MEYKLLSNTRLTDTVWHMVLEGDTAAITRPGQFVQLSVPGFYLRRPISVCLWDDTTLTLVYKVVGQGTAVMSALTTGTLLDVIPGLGNGFDINLFGQKPLLIGGGVGLPPMVGLCKALLAAGKEPTVLAGFNTASEVFLQEDIEAMGVPFVLCTMDGSAGLKGLVTDAMSDLPYDSIGTCGPLPMLKAVYNVSDVPGWFSFEERMGCGFGACMGCTVETKKGYKRICKDGPVLEREEILW